jgi:DNA mismatch endonuclease Vsr
MADRHTPEQRRKNMRAVKNKDSKMELRLRKALWERGYRYRKNCKDIFGKPDIAFLGKKVAIFCDSEFWHGYDWERKKHEIKSNKEFWYKKLEGNIKRDQQVNEELARLGWKVLRFWERDIKNDLEGCISKIADALGSTTPQENLHEQDSATPIKKVPEPPENYTP